MNTKRLLKLASFLREVPRRLYCQNQWGVKLTARGSKGLHCDTPGCALGWATAVFPRLLKFTDKENIAAIGKNGGVCSIKTRGWYDSISRMRRAYGVHAGQKVFDLSYEQANSIFGFSGMTNTTTPKQIAKKIETIVKAERVTS